MYPLQQVFPTVVGDMDSSGSLNAQVLLLLAERLRAKAVFQVTHGSCRRPLKHFPFLHECAALRGLPGQEQGWSDLAGWEGKALLLVLPTQTQQAKFLTWQFDGEYRGDDYTATLTLGNPDLIGESGEELGRGALDLGCSLADVGSVSSLLVLLRD